MLKKLIIPIGFITLLFAFNISASTGFALVIGLCIGSLGEKLGWWEINN